LVGFEVQFDVDEIVVDLKLVEVEHEASADLENLGLADLQKLDLADYLQKLDLADYLQKLGLADYLQKLGQQLQAGFGGNFGKCQRLSCGGP